MKVKLKKAVEVPSAIQALVDTLITSKHAELSNLLEGFKWTYDKGDFNHWVALFNYFDDVLEEALKDRPELSLSDSTPQQQPAGPFPVEACLAVLRTTATILEHCSNKHLYQSYDRLAALLVLDHDEVLCATLRTLEAFVRKTHSASVRWQGARELNGRLSAMCHLWGGSDQGLDMTTCSSEGVTFSKQALAEATALRFQFHDMSRPDAISGPVTITIPAVFRLGEPAHVLAQRLWQQHSLPQHQRFLLLSKIRVAMRMSTLEGRRAVVTQRLMAYNVLMMSTPTAEDLAPLTVSESEFVSDLVSLIAAELAVPELLRALALRAIAVQLQDRGRHTTIIAAMNSGGQSGFLSLLLHRSIASLVATSIAAAAQSGQESSITVAPVLPTHAYSLEFVESLLLLVQCLVSSSAGGTALADAGVIAALMPLLRSRHPDHVGLVTSAVKVLEGYIDFNLGAATAAFSESNGLQELISRLAYEVGVAAAPEVEVEGAEQEAATAGSSGSAAAGALTGCPAQIAASTAIAAASSGKGDGCSGSLASAGSSGSVTKLPYARTTLIKFLLRCLALACFSPQSTAAGRPSESVMMELYRSLGVMLRDAGRFGGSLFALAASVISDCLHSDPLQYRYLDEEGLPQAYLDAVKGGLLPSSDAICTIPGMLVALCLNTGGLARVKEQRVLEALIPIFTCRKYAKALAGDAAVMIGAGLEELFRFTPSLLSDGVDVVMHIIQAVCVLGGDEAETQAAMEQTRQKLEAACVDLAAESAPEITVPPVFVSESQAPAISTPIASVAAAGGTSEPMETDASDVAVGPGSNALPGSNAAAMDASTSAYATLGDEDANTSAGGEGQAASPSTAQAMELDGTAAAAAAAVAAVCTEEGAATVPVAANTVPEAANTAPAASPAPYDFTAVLAEAATVKDSDSFLTEALSHVTRMLEGLVTHTETSRLLVERGLIAMMLKINHLPRLSFTYAFSSPSHPLLSVARALAPNHATVASAKTTEALSAMLPIALERVNAIGLTACVPALPAAERAPYLKALASAAGLITLASVVARTSTAMLQQLSVAPERSAAAGTASAYSADSPAVAAAVPVDMEGGTEAVPVSADVKPVPLPTEPVLVTMGRLERALMAQADTADAWAMQRPESEKTGMTGDAAVASNTSTDGAAAMVTDAPAGPTVEAGGSASAGGGSVAASGAVATDGEDLAVVDADAAVPSAPLTNGDPITGAVTAAATSKSRRTPEELSHDVLHHSLLAIRTFYVAVAKAIHTSSRRNGREDAALALPTLGMRAAALCLSVNMKGNLDTELPLVSALPLTAAAGESGVGAGCCEVAATPAAVSSDQDAMAVDSSPTTAGTSTILNRRAVHLQRLADEANYLLLDSRRRSCHVLLLNYFVGIGGFQSLSRRFEQAAENMWAVLEAQAHSKVTSVVEPQNRHVTAATFPIVHTSVAALQGAGAAHDSAMAEGSALSSAVAAAAAEPVAEPDAAAAAASVAGIPGGDVAIIATRASASAVSAAVRRDPVTVAEKCLTSYLTVYEQMSNATTVFQSPQAAVLLCTGLPSAAGAAMLDQLKDPVELVKAIQNRILASVLPVWRHPSLPNCSPAVVASLVNIIRVCAEGASAAAAVLLRVNAAGGRGALGGALGRPQFVPDAAHVQTIVEMGFSAARAEEALRRVGNNSVEAAMEWLVMHPEEPAPATGGASSAAGGGASVSSVAATAPAQDDDALLGSCLTAALAGINQQPSDLHPPSAVATVGAAGAPAGDVAAAATSVATSTTASDAAAAAERPGVLQLVEGALAIVARSSAGTANLSDLLSTLACREGGKERGAVVSELLGALGRAAASAQVGSSFGGGDSKELLAAARLVLLLITRDSASVEVAAKADAGGILLSLLEEWMQGYHARMALLPPAAAAPKDGSAGSAAAAGPLTDDVVKGLSVPVWVEALLLVLEILASTAPRRVSQESTTAASRSAVPTTAAAGTSTAAGGSGGPTAVAAPSGSVPADAQPASPTGAGASAPEVAVPAGDAGPANLPVDVTLAVSAPDVNAAAEPATGGPGNAGSGTILAQAALGPALVEALSAWRPCGLLLDEEQARAMRLGTTLLQHLQAHGDKWCPPLRLAAVPSEEMVPSPSSATQAVLQLLGRLTRKHSNAAAAAAAGVPRLLLRLPSSCLLPNPTRHEPYMLFILRHVLEDPVTLGGWMEAEIRNYFAQRARGPAPMFGMQQRAQQNRNDAVVSMSSFLSAMSRLLNRDPYVFLDVLSRCCSLDPTSPLIRLKKPEQQQPAQPLPQQSPQTAGAATGARVAGGSGEPSRRPSNDGGSSGPAAMDLTPMAIGPTTASRTAQDGVKPLCPPVTPAMPPTLAKVTRKAVPASFVDVIDALVDVVMSYKGRSPTRVETAAGPSPVPAQQQSAATNAELMDIDNAPTEAGSTGAAAPQPTAADASPVLSTAEAEAQLQVLLRKSSDTVMQRLALRFLTEFSLLFSPTVGLLLKRDDQLAIAATAASLAEVASPAVTAVDAGKSHHGVPPHTAVKWERKDDKEKDVVAPRDKDREEKTPHAQRRSGVLFSGTGGKGAAETARKHQQGHAHVLAAAGVADAGAGQHRAGALLRHLIHVQLVCGDQMSGAGTVPAPSMSLTDKVNELLQAICVRSVEGRRRIISEIVSTLAVVQLPPGALDAAHRELILQMPPGYHAGAAGPYEERSGYPSPWKIRAVVQLVGGLLENSGAAPAQDPRRGNNNPQGAGAISTEIVRTMREQGMVRALTAALSTVNMEHPRAHQAVQAILRPLELLTRNAGAWAPKLAGCGALGGMLTTGPTTTRGTSVVRQPEGAGTGGAAMDDEARAEAGPAALRAMGRRGRADPMVGMLISRIDQAMEDMGARHVGTSSEDEEDEDDDGVGVGGGRRRRRRRHGGVDEVELGEGEDGLDDLDDMDEDDEEDEDEEGEEEDEEEEEGGEGELADELQMQRLQDEMSEDAEAGEGFSDGDDDALLHVAHHDGDLAGIEDVDIGDDEDEDGEAHEDDEDDDEEEDGAGDLGEDGAEELVDEEDDVEGDGQDPHDPFADPHNGPGDGGVPILARDGEVGMSMADGVDQDEGEGRGDDDDDGNGGEVEDEEGTDREYDEDEYEGADDGGEGRDRLFMETGPDGDLFPVVIRGARRSPGGTLTAQFHVPADLDDLGLNGGMPRAGLNALAELLQAGDWGGGAGRRNRTFRYRLVNAEGTNAVLGSGNAAAAAVGQGTMEPAQLLHLATTLMPSQHRLLLGRGGGNNASAAASVALAASNALPLGVAQQAGLGVSAGSALMAVTGPNTPPQQMLAALQNMIDVTLMDAVMAGGNMNANGGGFGFGGGVQPGLAHPFSRGFAGIDDLARVLGEPPYPGGVGVGRGVREEPRAGVDTAIDARSLELQLISLLRSQQPAQQQQGNAADTIGGAAASGAPRRAPFAGIAPHAGWDDLVGRAYQEELLRSYPIGLMMPRPTSAFPHRPSTGVQQQQGAVNPAAAAAEQPATATAAATLPSSRSAAADGTQVASAQQDEPVAAVGTLASSGRAPARPAGGRAGVSGEARLDEGLVSEALAAALSATAETLQAPGPPVAEGTPGPVVSQAQSQQFPAEAAQGGAQVPAATVSPAADAPMETTTPALPSQDNDTEMEDAGTLQSATAAADAAAVQPPAELAAPGSGSTPLPVQGTSSEAGQATPSDPMSADMASMGTAAAAVAAARATAPVGIANGAVAMGSGGASAATGEAEEHSLDERFRLAAVAAGIDLAFLAALPDDLRDEVLLMHGAALGDVSPPPPPAEAVAPAAAPATIAPAQLQQPAQVAADGVAPAAESGSAGAGEDITSAGHTVNAADTIVGASAVVEAAANASGDAVAMEEDGVDPEFLAALPEDLRQEVMAQQRAEQSRRRREEERRRSTAAAAAAPGPAELDLASLLATFPPDVRDEVLLTSDEALLATLPPMLRAEAIALRSRFQRNQAMAAAAVAVPPAAQAVPMRVRRPVPMMYGGEPMGARMVASRMIPGAAARGAVGYAELARKKANEKSIDEDEPADGPPLLDDHELRALVGLLRSSSLQQARVPLQRVLSNLCGHTATRRALLAMLLDIMRQAVPAAPSAEGQGGGAADMEVEETAVGSTGMHAAELTASASSGADALEAQATQQTAEGPSDPQLRRVLETLIFLSRNSIKVSTLLLYLRAAIKTHIDGAILQSSDSKGKGPAQQTPLVTSAQAPLPGPTALELLLATLGRPSGQQRGNVTIDLSLRLADVLLGVALARIGELREQEVESWTAAAEQARKAAVAAATPLPAPSTIEAAVTAAAATPTSAAEMETERLPVAAPSETPAQAIQPSATEPAGSDTVVETAGSTAATASGAIAAGTSVEPPPSAVVPLSTETHAELALLPARRRADELCVSMESLPGILVRQVPLLLSRPGLTEAAYTRVANVLQGLACAAPQAHAVPLLEQMTSELCRVGSSVTELLLCGAQHGVSDADSSVITGMATQGGHVLRLLRALQGFRSLPDLKMQQLLLPPNPVAGSDDDIEVAGSAAGPSSSTNAPPPKNYRAEAKAAFAALPGEARAAVATVATHLEPLWAALSLCITAIEDSMSRGSGTAVHSSGDVAAGAGTSTDGGTLQQAAGEGQDEGQAQAQRVTSGASAAATAAAAAAAAAAASAGGSSRSLPPGAGQVLPLVEAFFVMCALRDAIPSPAGGAGGPGAGSFGVEASEQAQTQRASGDGSGAAAAAVRGASPVPPPLPLLQSAGRGSSGPLLSAALISTTAATGGAGAGVSASTSAGAASSVQQREEERAAPFLRFAERHRRLLNAYLRRAPTLLEGSLSPLMLVPRLIDFDNKRSWFRSKVRAMPDNERPYGSLRLAVRREHVFEDSFYQLRGRPADEMKLKLNVTFQGEEGIDAGGVTREWYQVMAREMFNPNLALFVAVPDGGSTFQPNPNSHVQNDRGISHLDYFKFVGRIVGKALYDGQLLDAYFTRSFYKHLLGSPLTHVDLEAVDPEYYKALSWMLSNDITDVLDLTFTAETDFFGRKETLELVPGGKDLRVTESNKRDYVNLVARHRMTTSITAQINAFLEGFWQLVPRNLIAIFNDHELELLISGLPDIDVDDLRANTEYSGYSAISPVIRWFWEAVSEMDKQERAQLVQFVTGTSKVPLEGFKALQGISGPQKFQIHKAYGHGSRLPSAHTCFNQLDLPEYDSKEQLVERLKVAVHEGNVGFGFG